MAEIFISYCSKDREAAREVAAALVGRGHTVWWDRDIVTGESFDHVIERELGCAKAVVVLWTRDSVASEWVKNEAASAMERGVLLPVSLDEARPPLEFRRRQTANLSGWGGNPSHEGFQLLTRGVDKLLGGSARPQPTTIREEPASRSGRRVAAIVIAAIVIAGGGYFLFTRTGESPSASNSPPAQDVSPRGEPQASELDVAVLAVGEYSGDVVSDSRGSSRSNVAVTVSRLGANSVRVTSPYARIGTVDIEVQRIGNQVLNAGGDTPFSVNLDAQPPALSLSPRNELSYHGVRRSAADAGR